VSSLLIGLLSVLSATNQPAAVSNFVARTAGVSVTVTDPDDPVEKEYQKLLELDDAAQEEVDKWIHDNTAFHDQGAGLAAATLRARVEQRLKPVREAYDDFLRRHPDHAHAHLAYGSFLHDLHEEEAGVEHWEKARELDPKNPAAWNNLANHYGHRSPVKKAFEYYAKAIELNPKEPIYYQNFATTVYLFRHDAMEYYGIEEQQVFTKALGLYRQALKLDPNNFVLASDLAQSYYGIKPLRADEAIAAWEYAQKIAGNDTEREGVYLHLARFNLNAGRFDEARRNVNRVTNEVYAELKKRLLRNIEKQEDDAKGPDAAQTPSEKDRKDERPSKP
jgi:tetratricopeptide (TPR) repeat protein